MGGPRAFRIQARASPEAVRLQRAEAPGREYPKALPTRKAPNRLPSLPGLGEPGEGRGVGGELAGGKRAQKPEEERPRFREGEVAPEFVQGLGEEGKGPGGEPLEHPRRPPGPNPSEEGPKPHQSQPGVKAPHLKGA